MTSVASRNITMKADEGPSTTEGKVVEYEHVSSAEAAESSRRRRPVKIVWRNVIAMVLLHLGAVYALVLVPECQPLTWLWSKFEGLNVMGLCT
jgi:hypothetical protein